MRLPFGYSFKQIGAVALLGCAVAAGVVVFSGSSSADTKADMVSVNRADKADRQQPATFDERWNAVSSSSQAALRRPAPYGCDPAFSPVADPDRARVFRRCIT